jgi:hypothetical protein
MTTEFPLLAALAAGFAINALDIGCTLLFADLFITCLVHHPHLWWWTCGDGADANRYFSDYVYWIRIGIYRWWTGAWRAVALNSHLASKHSG